MSAAQWIDFVQAARDVGTGEQVSIVFLDTSDVVAQEFDAEGAREVAARLNALADEWDREKARPRLRRLPDVDEHHRDREGGV